MKLTCVLLTCIRGYLCLLDYPECFLPLTLRPIIRFISSVSSGRGPILLLPLVYKELLFLVGLGPEFSDRAPSLFIDFQLDWLIESGKVHRVIDCIIDGSIRFLHSTKRILFQEVKNLTSYRCRECLLGSSPSNYTSQPEVPDSYSSWSAPRKK